LIAMSHTQSLQTGLRRFLTGPGLPTFLLTLVALYEAFLLAVIFAPEGSGPWSTFALEFKVWCFSYDTRTGGMEWSAVWMMLLEPLFITGIVVVVWRKGLGALLTLRGWSEQRRPAMAGVMVAAAALGVLYLYGQPSASAGEPLPFPGERIRTRIEPPPFTLTDQLGEAVELAALRGRPVLITGVYAHCTTACPTILLELRTLLDQLPAAALEELQVVAISLDPERDTTEVMAAVARAYNFTHPQFRFVNGEPEAQREILKRYQFGAYLNERTGVIEHANLFILVDAEGRIAYRFNLDPRHSPWIREAVVALAAEAAAQRHAHALAAGR